MRIYAGNLSVDVTENGLRRAFQAFGHVSYVKLNAANVAIFALIGMPESIDAKRAIREMNGELFKGTIIEVKEAGVIHVNSEAVPEWTFYRWQLERVVAVSAESFSSRSACMLNAGERGYKEEV